MPVALPSKLRADYTLVADAAARFALTGKRLGDFAHQQDTGRLWQLIRPAESDSALAWLDLGDFPSAEALEADLYDLWRMADESGDEDHTLANNGGVSFTSGRAQFDGGNRNLGLNPNPITGTFTFLANVKFNDFLPLPPTDVRTVFSTYEDSDKQIALYALDDGTLRVLINDGSDQTLDSAAPLVAGANYFLAVTFSQADGLLTLKISGRADVTLSGIGTLPSANNFRLGKHGEGSGAPYEGSGNFMSGSIGPVAIFNEALTPDALEDIASGAFSINGFLFADVQNGVGAAESKIAAQVAAEATARNAAITAAVAALIADPTTFAAILAAAGITPVADNAYTTGLGVSSDGSLTTKTGIPTSITNAA